MHQLSLMVHRITPALFASAVFVVATLVYLSGYQRDALLILFLLLSTFAALYVVKVLFNTKRRTDSSTAVQEDRAFPSGHAGSAALLIPTLTYTLPWGEPIVIAVTTALLALVVSYSRLYLKVHRPYEVLAGLVIGAGIPLAILNLLHYLNV